jgi:GTP-binding protein
LKAKLAPIDDQISLRPKLPLIAIVGRPNVGKSTLFNRISGKHRALVSKEPGMTRDRRFELADWTGRFFQIIDTGGMQGEEDVLSRLISQQVKKAVEQSDLVLSVVDGREGLTARDQEIANYLRRSGMTVFLLVNKVDTPARADLAAEFHALGFAEVFPVSAEHGLGVDEVLDRAIDFLQIKQSDRPPREEVVPVAILGKPNAGKSTFLNSLIGEERLVTSEIPGTTRDTIDIDTVHEGAKYRFIDTAGIRKKGQTKTLPDKLAVIHARQSLERAEIACIMIDAKEGITHQDAVVAGYALEAGKAMVLLFNKIDLLDAEQRKGLEKEADSKLQFIRFVPRLYISAKTGQNVRKVFPILRKVYESYAKRVTTGQLNSFFDQTLSNRYLGSYRGKPIKLRYITQASVKPPTFVLFTNASSQLHFSHRRYLENQLRNFFGFEGSPLRIRVRAGSRK